MDRLKVKQVEGAMDTVSAQDVSGEKRFSAPQAFLGESWNIVIANGFIYWVQNPATLDELGNSRLRIEEGLLVVEIFQDEWVKA